MRVFISATAATPSIAQPKVACKVLGALSASHMINDMMQSLILAMYPILKGDFHLSFAQIGLIPGKVGMVSGLFFGFAFGMGGLGAAMLGVLADRTSIEYVYHAIAYLPLLGVVAAFLPRSRLRD